MKLLWLGLVLIASTLGAPPDGLEGQSPEQVASRFAAAWQSEREGAIERLLAPGGARLSLEGDGYGGVAPRRILAALGSYWQDWATSSVEVARVSQMDEEPNRAYGELVWRGASEVTGETFEATIFLGLVRTDGGWRVDELRTIRPR